MSDAALKIARSVPVAALLATGLVLSSWFTKTSDAAPAGSKVCHGFVVGHGIGKSVAQGLSKARSHWVNQVTATYGASFANTGIALQHPVSAPPCQDSGSHYRCQFQARPCGHVRLGTTPK